MRGDEAGFGSPRAASDKRWRFVTGLVSLQYWLMKSEPDVFSIEDLERETRTFWDGVRNYEARNMMRDQMKPGDLMLFYHSNAKPSGVAGVGRVVAAGRPDETAFDKADPHYDPDSDPREPRWFGVDVEFVERFPEVVSLHDIKATPSLAQMSLLRRSRLSVTPVVLSEWKVIRKMAGMP